MTTPRKSKEPAEAESKEVPAKPDTSERARQLQMGQKPKKKD